MDGDGRVGTTDRKRMAGFYLDGFLSGVDG